MDELLSQLSALHLQASVDAKVVGCSQHCSRMSGITHAVTWLSQAAVAAGARNNHVDMGYKRCRIDDLDCMHLLCACTTISETHIRHASHITQCQNINDNSQTGEVDAHAKTSVTMLHLMHCRAVVHSKAPSDCSKQQLLLHLQLVMCSEFIT